MFHRITIIGFVGQPPSMRYTEDGTAVTNFSVATRQVVSKERVAACPTGWKESLNGKNWELTTWFRVTCWRKLAEAANEFLEKGQQVFVEGELRGDAIDGNQNPRVWTGNDGEARATSLVLGPNDEIYATGGRTAADGDDVWIARLAAARPGTVSD